MTSVIRTLTYEDFKETLVLELQSLQEADKYCDVTLKVGNRQFKAHKVILVANSQYFRAYFSKGKRKGKDNFVLHNIVKPAPFEVILKYFYSGQLSVSLDTVESVLGLADFFQLAPAKKMIQDYLLSVFIESRCIWNFNIAAKYNLEELKLKTADILLNELSTISNMSDFLCLEQDAIFELLKTNKEPKRAELLFATIIKWVQHNEEHREKVLCDLLQLLPPEGLSREFRLTNMMHVRVLRRNRRSKKWLFQNLLPDLAASNSAVVAQMKTFFITSRCNDDGTCYRVNLEDRSLVVMEERPQVGLFSGVCYSNTIHMLCGMDTEEVFRYSEVDEDWYTLSLNLDFNRFNVGCALIGDVFYGIGGLDRKNALSGRHTYPLRSFQSFDFSSQKKLNLPCMKVARDIPGVGVYGGSIYVTGGREAAPSVERYDLREGEWHVVGRYEHSFVACSSAVSGDFLYTADSHCCGRIERFDFRTNRSVELKTAATEYGSYITCLDDIVYLCLRDKIVKYNAAADLWEDFCSGFFLEPPIIVPWIKTVNEAAGGAAPTVVEQKKQLFNQEKM